MIRIRYEDTELIIGVRDVNGDALKFDPSDSCAWVPVINSAGFTLEYLAGGERETPALMARATPAAEVKK